MPFSNESGQTNPESDVSGWQTCQEQVVDKASKLQEWVGAANGGGGQWSESEASNGNTSVDEEIFCCGCGPPPL